MRLSPAVIPAKAGIQLEISFHATISGCAPAFAGVTTGRGAEGPLTRRCAPTSPPKGEVKRAEVAVRHLSLGGEVDGEAGG